VIVLSFTHFNKIIFFAFFIFFCSYSLDEKVSAAPGDAVVFTGSGGLRNCVNVTIFGRAATATITQGEMATLTELYCDWADTAGAMTNLNGIEFATNLTVFQAINYANLANISKISTLTNLRELYLYKNAIINIGPLSTLVNLEVVELQNNAISSITALSSLNKLNYVNLSYNTISDASPLINKTTLRYLHIRNNSISNLTPISTLTGLLELSLQVNTFETIIPLRSLPVITYLNITGNSIYISTQALLDAHTDLYTRAGLSYFSDIPPPNEIILFTDLEMRKCLLMFFLGVPVDDFNITKTNMTTITVLGCVEPLKVVTDLKYATNLTRLNLVGSDFSAFPDFREITSLQYLTINSTNLVNVNPLYLSGMNNLLGVNLGQNMISDVSFIKNINSPNLEEFQLQNNLINRLPDLTGTLYSLYFLDVRNNAIILSDKNEVIKHNFLLNNLGNYQYDYARGVFGITEFLVTSLPESIILNAQEQTSTFDFSGTLNITDTRDTLSGNSMAGWNMQLEVSDLVDGIKIIPKNDLTLRNLDTISVLGISGDSGSVNTSSPITLLSLPIGEGAGIYPVDFSNVQLDVLIRPTTKVGNYIGNINLQLVTGP
jgi:Leucine-rich repeat (LRR) protein